MLDVHARNDSFVDIDQILQVLTDAEALLNAHGSAVKESIHLYLDDAETANILCKPVQKDMMTALKSIPQDAAATALASKLSDLIEQQV